MYLATGRHQTSHQVFWLVLLRSALWVLHLLCEVLYIMDQASGFLCRQVLNFGHPIFEKLPYSPNDCFQISICDHVSLPTPASHTPATSLRPFHTTLVLRMSRLFTGNVSLPIIPGDLWEVMTSCTFSLKPLWEALVLEWFPLEVKSEDFAFGQTWIWFLDPPFITCNLCQSTY